MNGGLIGYNWCQNTERALILFSRGSPAQGESKPRSPALRCFFIFCQLALQGKAKNTGRAYSFPADLSRPVNGTRCLYCFVSTEE